MNNFTLKTFLKQPLIFMWDKSRQPIKKQVIRFGKDSQKIIDGSVEHVDPNPVPSLDQNVESVSKEKENRCESCAKFFKTTDNLKRHRRIHTEDKPFKCQACKKRFTQTDNLKKHTTSHTGERKYECNICFKQFARSDTLKQHQVIHTDLKEYQCQDCTQTFNQRSSLKRHTLIHKGV